MIAALIRRDIAFREAFYVWLVLSIFVGIILASAGKTISLDPGINSLSFPSTGSVIVYALLVSWLLLSLYLGPAEVADHCNRWTINLPLPTKTLWLSRVFALAVAESVLFITTGLVIVLVNLITGSSTVFPTFLAKFLIQQFTCILLLIIVIQSLYIKRMAMPSIFSSYAILLMVWAAAGALLYALVQFPFYYLLIPLSGGTIIFLITLYRLPASFTTEPKSYPMVRPHNQRGIARSPGLLSRAKTRWIVWITLFRTLYNPWLSPLFLLASGVLAMANMDYGLQGKGHFTFVIGIWMFLFLLQSLAFQQMYKLDHLPISRRAIYACQVLPSIIVIFIMSIIGISAAKTTVNLNSSLVPWTRALPINLVLILLPWLFMQSFIFAAPRASGLRARLSILTAVCSLGYIATLLFRFIPDSSSKLSELFTIFLTDLTERITIETPFLWILAIIILISGYFIAERLFCTAPLAKD